jgi:hypothetical protein
MKDAQQLFSDPRLDRISKARAGARKQANAGVGSERDGDRR